MQHYITYSVMTNEFVILIAPNEQHVIFNIILNTMNLTREAPQKHWH
jgi:hypothetical protein